MNNTYHNRFPNVVNIIWTIFAILLTILLWGILSLFVMDPQESISFIESLDCSLTMLGIISLYGLGLKKKIITHNFWKVYFFINLFIMVLDIIFQDEFKYRIPPWLSLICWLIPTFYFIGMFVYAFRSPHIWGAKRVKEDASQSYDIYTAKKRQKSNQRDIRLIIAVIISVILLTFLRLIVVNNQIIDKKERNQYRNYSLLEFRRDKIPQISMYEKLFPEFRDYLIYSKGFSDNSFPKEHITEKSPFDASWYFEAGIYERYVLEMKIELNFYWQN